MQDPKNRAEYEREIAKYEAQVAAENAGKDPFAQQKAETQKSKKEKEKIVEQPVAKSKSVIKGLVQKDTLKSSPGKPSLFYLYKRKSSPTPKFKRCFV
ncbi:Oidioi.mRNA.OKI2018_I69.chr1.g2563.t1.cds [Oikopleura dioica]|uniref:Oidioi.mRNA.OKI2018_I69.chr1.g2563.t1.cds n=1 Tax=Oikopleura dioica TaxID=34765 RepID=A0ABN7SRH3_OIKDI|nr:Oidioi.mRNA.OKI2018_I69.chr1.g2563.t1.cds [Oikopleura dioica]